VAALFSGASLRRLSLILTIALFALPLSAATRPYHLELEATPTAPFPFLGKFGNVTLHVYGGGVRAETIWLNGFTRNGAPAVTVMNPLGRMYTDVPIAQISAVLTKLAGNGAGEERMATGTLLKPTAGKVRGIDASRYRIVYGADAWIDVWTTKVIPENQQLRAIVEEFVRGISPGTAAVAKDIPGTPVYVELNFRRFKKLPILKLKSLAFDNAGEDDALKIGPIYIKAPLLDSIWK
jgi:hypothetical protein